MPPMKGKAAGKNQAMTAPTTKLHQVAEIRQKANAQKKPAVKEAESVDSSDSEALETIKNENKKTTT